MTRDGHRYTIVDFSADQGDAVITVDAKGGVYTGAVTSYDEIYNPASQYKYIMANYCFNEWDGNPNNWHDETDSPLHKELFEAGEQLLNSRGVKGSIAITEPTTGLQLTNLFSDEYFPVFWTPDAKLAIRPDDWYFTYNDWYASRARLEENAHFLSELSYHPTSEMLADEWDIGFLYSAADSEALERIRVKDTLRGWGIKEPSLDLKWSESTV